MASCRACLGHGDLAARPGAPEFDRATRSLVFRPSRLEEVQDVFRARSRPQGEEMVIGISEGPTAADRHETGVAFFRENQPSTALARIRVTSTAMPSAPSGANSQRAPVMPSFDRLPGAVADQAADARISPTLRGTPTRSRQTA